jgi:hypothetical protein
MVTVVPVLPSNGVTLVITGAGITVYVRLVLPVHPESVPATVYVTEPLPTVVTEVPVVALKPVDGDHV